MCHAQHCSSSGGFLQEKVRPGLFQSRGSFVGMQRAAPSRPRIEIDPAYLEAGLLQFLSLFARGEFIDKLVDFAVHKAIKAVAGEVDAMIGHTVLWIVVRADFLRAIPAAH